MPLINSKLLLEPECNVTIGLYETDTTSAMYVKSDYGKIRAAELVVVRREVPRA